jgi:antitoxin component YwqK of YwqJK toxin-antitoxin module
MKFIFFILILLILGACSPNKERLQTNIAIPNTELLADNEAFGWQQDVLLYNGKPYSGFTIEKYISGKLASRNGYINGKLEGKQEKWFENGLKQELRFYSQNHKIGKHEGWYPNGQKRFEYFIENDIPIKTHQEWYDNGQLFSKFNYNNEGQPEGTQQMWYATGQIKANYFIKNGRRFGFLGAKGCMGENERKNNQISSVK